MTVGTKLPASFILLMTPLAAYADGTPHIVVYSLVGSFVGGFLGAGLACWLCKRRGSRDETEPKKY
jgi:hypothetical protein